MDAIGSISECVKQMRTLPAISATDLASVREWIEDERRRGFGCERLDHLQQEVDAMYLQQEAEALHGDLRALQDMAASIHCMVTEEGDMVARTDSMSEMTSEHVQAAVVGIAEAAKEQNCVRVKQATLAGAAVGKIIGCGSYAVGAAAGILASITSARLDRKIDDH